MSFTLDVTEELLASRPQKTCCRKAMLYGSFFAAVRTEDGGLLAQFKAEPAADFAVATLAKQFSVNTEKISCTRAGKKVFRVEAKARALTAFADALDRDGEGELDAIVGFRCAECSHAFLKGVFIACGTVNDPHKGYHMEFSVPDMTENGRRAERLAALLASEVTSPKLLKRGGRIGVYFKSNAAISDVLCYIGGMKSGFEVANICIEHDIRNTENRATNCITGNISRSVDASRRQTEIISKLSDSGALNGLPDELRYTARLRLENPSATLYELALIHEPPISKSGLNRRLCKLSRIFEEKEEQD